VAGSTVDLRLVLTNFNPTPAVIGYQVTLAPS